MRRRQKSFRHWVAIPALASVGLTLVAYGQNLILEEVTLSAPAAAQPGGAQPAPAQASPEPGAAANPEFGGRGTGGPTPAERGRARIRSTTQADLVRRARESSGRDDPFVSLVLPQAIVIQPLYVPTPPPTRTTVFRPRQTRVNTSTGRQEVFNEDRGTWEEITTFNPNEPRWTVLGIMNTGRESLVILDLDGAVTREAHIGEVLEDGSKVVAISGSQVTLLAGGRRYVKTIGGLEPQ